MLLTEIQIGGLDMRMTNTNKTMMTEKQIQKMTHANLTRLQIANLKNDNKQYTDKEIEDYIKACK